MMQGLLEIRVSTCRCKQVVTAKASEIESKAEIGIILFEMVALYPYLY
jgi:hypothetical protein